MHELPQTPTGRSRSRRRMGNGSWELGIGRYGPSLKAGRCCQRIYQFLFPNSQLLSGLEGFGVFMRWWNGRGRTQFSPTPVPALRRDRGLPHKECSAIAGVKTEPPALVLPGFDGSSTSTMSATRANRHPASHGLDGGLRGFSRGLCDCHMPLAWQLGERGGRAPFPLSRLSLVTFFGGAKKVTAPAA